MTLREATQGDLGEPPGYPGAGLLRRTAVGTLNTVVEIKPGVSPKITVVPVERFDAPITKKFEPAPQTDLRSTTLGEQGRWAALATDPRRLHEAQHAILEGFDPASVPDDIQVVDSGKWRMTTSAGTFQVRMRNQDDDLGSQQHAPYDAFMSQVLADLGVPTQITKGLAKDNPLAKFLQAHAPLHQADPFLGQHVKWGAPIQISVSTDLNLPSGKAWAHSEVGTGLRWGMMALKGADRWMQPENVTDGFIQKQWSTMSSAAQARLKGDLASMAPDVKWNDGDVVASVKAAVESLSADELSRLHDKAWDHLPPKVRTQLADLWAGHTVLGANDCDWNAWGMVGETVVGKSSMARTKDLIDGKAGLELEFQASPMSGAPLSDRLRMKMLQDVSPGLKDRLRNLTTEGVTEAGRDSGYHWLGQEVQGILARAAAVTGEAQEPTPQPKKRRRLFF